MAGVSLDSYNDGINQWSLISTGIPANQQRSTFVYNLDPPLYALRHHGYKLVFESSNPYLFGHGRVKLYQLSTDPYEYKNIARRHPKLVKQLLNKIFEHQKLSRTPVRTVIDEAGNPRRFKGVYATGWCE